MCSPGLVTPARLTGIVLLALMTANCSSPTAVGGRHGNKYGVAPSPKVIPDGQPIPKGGGRDMIGKPYVVGDKTYVPRDGKGYVREGEASWYGTAFHGRLTANGEIFDKESIAAAHPTLPLPSYVRVTNTDNNRSMIVRVNDRGPYERGRLIDVSERAAQALDFHRRGTTHVRVTYVGKASLAGSDDRKLLATLRTDGTPAGFERRGPVMLASLDERGQGAPLAYKPAEPRPASVRVAREETEEERPAPVVLASRDLGPPSRLSQDRLQEERLENERSEPAPRAAGSMARAAPRIAVEPEPASVAGLNPGARAPVRMAERSLAKSDRLAPERAAASKTGRAGQPLDLAAIRATINAAPIAPPSRPGALRGAPSSPAGKLQAQLPHKGDRLRVADDRPVGSRSAMR
jgi:rare lipoprotein A